MSEKNLRDDQVIKIQNLQHEGENSGPFYVNAKVYTTIEYTKTTDNPI